MLQLVLEEFGVVGLRLAEVFGDLVQLNLPGVTVPEDHLRLHLL